MQNTDQALIKYLTNIITQLKTIQNHATDSLALAPKQYEHIFAIMFEGQYYQFADFASSHISSLAHLPFTKHDLQVASQFSQKSLLQKMKQANRNAQRLTENEPNDTELLDPNGFDHDDQGRALRPIMSSDIRKLAQLAIYYVHYTYCHLQAVTDQHGQLKLKFAPVDWQRFCQYAMLTDRCRYLIAREK